MTNVFEPLTYIFGFCFLVFLFTTFLSAKDANHWREKNEESLDAYRRLSDIYQSCITRNERDEKDLLDKIDNLRERSKDKEVAINFCTSAIDEIVSCDPRYIDSEIQELIENLNEYFEIYLTLKKKEEE